MLIYNNILSFYDIINVIFWFHNLILFNFSSYWLIICLLLLLLLFYILLLILLLFIYTYYNYIYIFIYNLLFFMINIFNLF